MFRRPALLALVFAASAGDAVPAAPLPPAEKQSLDGFAAANPDCREWSDGCVICERQAQDAFGCSTSGIACTPSALACRSPALPPAKP